MPYTVEVFDKFRKEAKRLRKKYPSLDADLAELVAELVENPTMGVLIAPNIYKVRMAISSKNKGKSGGARIITYLQVIYETIYLMTIYDKSEQADMDIHEINELLEDLPDEK
jgi:mRNA-degrading endonuclease RelE of RelBE toxin-antitoxin system